MRKLFFASTLIAFILGIWIGSSGYYKPTLAWAAGKNYDRYRMNLAVPLNEAGNPLAWFRQPFVAGDFGITGTTTRLQAWKRITRRLMNRCEKIGAGTQQEEPTMTATHHTCNHDVKTACGTEINIGAENDNDDKP